MIWLAIVILGGSLDQNGGLGSALVGIGILAGGIATVATLIHRGIFERKHPSKQPEKEVDQKYFGVKGWLAWLVFGLCLAAAITAFYFVSYISGYQTLIDNGYAFYAYFESIGEVAAIILALVCVYLILRKKRVAVKVSLAYFVLVTIFQIIDVTMAADLYQKLGTNQPADLYNDLGRTVLSSLIWIPYLLSSKRVKATLIN